LRGVYGIRLPVASGVALLVFMERGRAAELFRANQDEKTCFFL
jgi:hypothetical protein